MQRAAALLTILLLLFPGSLVGMVVPQCGESRCSCACPVRPSAPGPALGSKCCCQAKAPAPLPEPPPTLRRAQEPGSPPLALLGTESFRDAPSLHPEWFSLSRARTLDPRAGPRALHLLLGVFLC